MVSCAWKISLNRSKCFRGNYRIQCSMLFDFMTWLHGGCGGGEMPPTIQTVVGLPGAESGDISALCRRVEYDPLSQAERPIWVRWSVIKVSHFFLSLSKELEWRDVVAIEKKKKNILVVTRKLWWWTHMLVYRFNPKLPWEYIRPLRGEIMNTQGGCEANKRCAVKAVVSYETALRLPPLCKPGEWRETGREREREEQRKTEREDGRQSDIWSEWKALKRTVEEHMTGFVICCREKTWLHKHA